MRSRESFAAVLLRSMVRQKTVKLTEEEYNAAVRYVIRKYHMEDRDGSIDLRGQDIGYIAELVAEAVGQARLAEGTFEIARNDRELNERNETA
jgi:uncharacterized protein YaiL (DUF2058 family)